MPVISTSERTENKRIIYRCKRCKISHAKDVQKHILTMESIGVNGGMPHRETYVTYDGNQSPAPWQCPQCHTVIYGDMVVGYVSDHVCDARCMGAIGKICECSCGGANHGKNHL